MHGKGKEVRSLNPQPKARMNQPDRLAFGCGFIDALLAARRIPETTVKSMES